MYNLACEKELQNNQFFSDFGLSYQHILLQSNFFTSVSKSDEESVEEVGEPVSIVVLNDIDPK